MDYTVKRYKAGSTERELWRNHSLETIRDRAQQWVERGEAERVHVRDSSGKLVLRYPK